MTTFSQTRRGRVEVLHLLSKYPSTSYHEQKISAVIESFLTERGLKPERDTYGNLLAHYQQNTQTAPVVLLAHMDHPGFHIIDWAGTEGTAQALGGVAKGCFTNGTPLRLITEEGEAIPGESMGPSGEDGQQLLRLRATETLKHAYPAFVVPEVTDFTVEEERIRMRALDDLAGCAAILLTLESLIYSNQPGNVIGVFTRAEEVGLLGARLLADSGMIPAQSTVISIESSRALPGATLGGGPVVRVGDATSTFSDEAERLLREAGRRIWKRDPSFALQRQLMSGGTCEASAFVAAGYTATGLAFPLENYHNAAPDDRVDAEAIHPKDYLGGLELLLETVQVALDPPGPDLYRRIATVPEEIRHRLRDENIAL